MRSLTHVLWMLVAVSAPAVAQDTAFSELRLRGGVFRNPVSGFFSEDWRARTGFHAEAASNVGIGEVSLAVSRLGYTPTTAKPAFTGTHVSLGWTARALETGSASMDVGARLAAFRMDFDDPAMVAGLRGERETLFDVIARGRYALGGRFSAYTHVSYGVLMLSRKTPLMLVSAGVEHATSMPGWLRDFLR